MFFLFVCLGGGGEGGVQILFRRTDHLKCVLLSYYRVHSKSLAKILHVKFDFEVILIYINIY